MTAFLYMLAGIALLLILKYFIFGLDIWDSVLHPNRIEPLDSPFRKPLLGLI